MRVALTDRFVAGAKSKDAPQTDYFDETTAGLTLRVSTTGKKVWSYVFTSPKDGKRARITFGPYPAISLARARARAIEAGGQVEEGVDPRDLAATRDATCVTVSMLFEHYLEMHIRPNVAARCGADMEQRFRKNVLPLIGAVRLAELHARDINRVLDPIVKRERPSTANHVFRDLRAMLNWAVKRHDLDKNPITGMGEPAIENGPKDRCLSDDEIRYLLETLPTALRKSITCQRILRLELVTGQRCGEIAGMRKDELDLGKRLWRLPGTRTKNGNSHVVPLSDLAADIIKEAVADASDTDFIFPSGDNSTEPHAVAAALRRGHQRGSFAMAPFTTHDLRRTVLTNLARLGVQPIVIGAVANHLSVTKASVTFAHYVQHDYAKEKAEALELWAERLAAIVVVEPTAEITPLRKRTASV